MSNSIIKQLKDQIKEQEAQIKQLYDTNNKLMALINNISSAEMSAAADELESPVITSTCEFIETAISKVKNCVIPGVSRVRLDAAASELSSLIKIEDATDLELICGFHSIIDKYIYRKINKTNDDSTTKRIINLLGELGYEIIETPKGSSAIGPYWERTIGAGTRVDVVYRPPFKLKNESAELYLRGVCSTSTI